MINIEASFIRQGFDHLGELNAKLRDLRGFDTLANGLLQNADDAKAMKLYSMFVTTFLWLKTILFFRIVAT